MINNIMVLHGITSSTLTDLTKHKQKNHFYKKCLQCFVSEEMFTNHERFS